jgi:hypothetical protein
VVANLIRAKGGSSPRTDRNETSEEDTTKKFKEGDKIEANFKDEGRCFTLALYIPCSF